MPIQKLINHLNDYLPLNEEEIADLNKRATVRKIKRRQYLLAAGEVCKFYNFVVEGCFKMYKIDEAAKEHNLMFAIENEWITDIGSFHSEQPSQLYIEAVEPAQIIQIAKPDLLHFYTNHLKFNRTFRVIIEDQFVELQNRLLQTISTTAEERYFRFMKDYPRLLNRLSNTQIASYIGITPEFLSRIRSQQASK
ncbi:MAG: Crp/Fnr family transcriptional regulator [Reichenbachiella sp.]|uniref:Crp/Fnr family transcriptional regulator n=1 Tax=Reichenbachiella sp. TaxID=2184521 RepID=UPI0032668A6B